MTSTIIGKIAEKTVVQQRDKKVFAKEAKTVGGLLD